MRYWVGIEGTGPELLSNEWWIEDAVWSKAAKGLIHRFSVEPKVRTGDRLVMYATGSPDMFGAGRFFAVREVVSDPEPHKHERWPWKVVLRDIVNGPDLKHCPTIDEIGVAARSLVRKAHIKLDRASGVRAEQLLFERSRVRQ